MKVPIRGLIQVQVIILLLTVIVVHIERAAAVFMLMFRARWAVQHVVGAGKQVVAQITYTQQKASIAVPRILVKRG